MRLLRLFLLLRLFWLIKYCNNVMMIIPILIIRQWQQYWCWPFHFSWWNLQISHISLRFWKYNKNFHLSSNNFHSSNKILLQRRYNLTTKNYNFTENHYKILKFCFQNFPFFLVLLIFSYSSFVNSKSLFFFEKIY